MAKVLLRITYRLQAHNVHKFEVILLDEIIPLVQKMGIHRPTIWKCFVGEAGEFMELWEFESMADFEEKWRRLMALPRLHKIFQVTGPMVQDERFALFDPLQPGEERLDLDFTRYSV